MMPDPELQTGSRLPDFSLSSNTGSEISPADYLGKKVVLFLVREYN
jgi:peroxiredoxin